MRTALTCGGLYLLVVLLPLCSLAADAEYFVTRIINGNSFTVSTGETVRLAAIETPYAPEETTPSHYGRPGEPLGQEAKAALAGLIAGKKIALQVIAAHDRHDRLLAQVYAGDTWVQGALLRQGFAMVYSFSDTPPDITRKMLTEERAARAAKLGIWANPYYRVITPSEADNYINRFKVVEGKVVSVHESRGNIYVNFFEEWRGHFAVFISHKFADSFTNLQALAGKTIRVRGWIHYHNAAVIDLTHPEEIEVE